MTGRSRALPRTRQFGPFAVIQWRIWDDCLVPHEPSFPKQATNAKPDGGVPEFKGSSDSGTKFFAPRETIESTNSLARP
jgi:hypothetical protein